MSPFEPGNFSSDSDRTTSRRVSKSEPSRSSPACTACGSTTSCSSVRRPSRTSISVHPPLAWKCRDLAGGRHAAASKPDLPYAVVFREDRSPATTCRWYHADRQRYGVLEHLPAVSGVRRRRALLRSEADGQRLGESTSQISGRRSSTCVSPASLKVLLVFRANVFDALFRIHYQPARLFTGLPVPGTYSAYALPGRTFRGQGGVTW